MRVADTQRFTLADTQSAEQSILNPSTYPTGRPRSELVCPVCNTETKNLGRHFAVSCEYPLLTEDEASTLLGAWLVGGFVNPPEYQNRTPRLIIRAADPQRLAVTEEYLGVCGRHSFDMNTSSRKQLNTVPHPDLRELYTADREEVQFTRTMAEVVYVLRGTSSGDRIIFKNLIDPQSFTSALESVGMDGEITSEKTVTLAGDDAQAFRSWANTRRLEKRL